METIKKERREKRNSAECKRKRILTQNVSVIGSFVGDIVSLKLENTDRLKSEDDVRYCCGEIKEQETSSFSYSLSPPPAAAAAVAEWFRMIGSSL